MAKQFVYTTVLSSRAQKEIIKSWTWHEDRQQGLGDRFLQGIIARIQKIQETPDRFPTRFKTYKESNVGVLPFLIIYRINKKRNS